MNQPTDPVAFARRLLACPSVTPQDAGAQAALAEILAPAGFAVTRMTFGEGAGAVPNLYATIGQGAPHLVFGGHTDVVPPGDATHWTHPPFAAETVPGLMISSAPSEKEATHSRAKMAEKT